MRDVTQLHPELQQKVAQLIELCNKNGLKIGIGECLRTVEEQDALYAQGRTKPGNIVTNARGSSYGSCHQFGIAFDTFRNDGKGAYNDSDGFFTKVGHLGQSIGLEWGGSWKTIIDKPHFQLPYWGSSTSELKRLYGTPENFMKTWKPVDLTPADPNEKYGKLLEEKKFVIIKDTYLRSTPEVGDNKIAYGELSAKLNAKCRKDDKGYAIIEKGSVITRVRSYRDDNSDKWFQLKSGPWMTVLYQDTRRVKDKK